MSAQAVIGLGFGDEGKGQTVHSLCYRNAGETMVVRFSGGQQAGHTVTLLNGNSHVFSNFGSGTLAGAPTYWSRHCTIDPSAILAEYHALQMNHNVSPVLYIDRRCPVTTPFDKIQNCRNKKTLMDGTCGVGVGQTWQREDDHYSLLAGDLEIPSVAQMKTDQISNYYGIEIGLEALNEFIDDLNRLLILPGVKLVDEMPRANHYVFEGSQGLLLDQDIGFFPHVTRSNTGSHNISEHQFLARNVEYYLVTRAYQTRHGNGPMTNEDRAVTLINNPSETNVDHVYQGKFRKTVLDASLLKYGLSRDPHIRHAANKKLVITCCDQIAGKFRFTYEGKMHVFATAGDFGDELSTILDINKVCFSWSEKNPILNSSTRAA